MYDLDHIEKEAGIRSKLKNAVRSYVKNFKGDEMRRLRTLPKGSDYRKVLLPGETAKTYGARALPAAAIAGINETRKATDDNGTYASVTSEDLEKIAAEDPNLAEAISLELMNKTAGIFSSDEEIEHARQVRGASMNELSKLPNSQRRTLMKIIAKNPNVKDYAESRIDAKVSEDPRLQLVQDKYKKDNQSMIRGLGIGGTAGTLGGLGIGALIANAVKEKNPSKIKTLIQVAAPTVGTLAGAVGGVKAGVNVGGNIGAKHLKDVSEEEARQLARTENEVIKDVVRKSFDGGYLKGSPQQINSQYKEANEMNIDREVLEKIASQDPELAEEVSTMILEKEAAMYETAEILETELGIPKEAAFGAAKKMGDKGIKFVRSGAKNVAGKARKGGRFAKDLGVIGKHYVGEGASKGVKGAKNLAGKAGSKARNVAGQAKNVAGQAGSKAKNVAGQAKNVAGGAGSKAKNVAGKAGKGAKNVAGKAGKGAKKVAPYAGAAAAGGAGAYAGRDQIEEKLEDIKGITEKDLKRIKKALRR